MQAECKNGCVHTHDTHFKMGNLIVQAQNTVPVNRGITMASPIPKN
jgi:hypothetical protein